MSSGLFMRLLVISDAPRVAGSETWLSRVLPRLRDYGIQSCILLPHSNLLDPFAKELQSGGIEVRRYRKLEQELSSKGYDLRLIQAWQPSTYVRLLTRKSVPSAVVVHEQIEYWYPLFHHLYRATFKLTRMGYLRQADALITVSGWATRWLEQHQAARRLYTVLNGVDTQHFAPASSMQRQNLREKLGFRRPTVVVAGRFALEKNQPLALRLARTMPEYDFIFTGDMDSSIGWLCKQLKRRWQLRNVHFWGRRSDMPDIYRAADVLLQPTYAENQSLVTLEAMGSGLTVVSSDIPAQSELIEHGQNGLLAPVNFQSQQTALHHALGNPELRERLGQAARAKILARHTLEGCAQNTAQVLYRIAETSHSENPLPSLVR